MWDCENFGETKSKQTVPTKTQSHNYNLQLFSKYFINTIHSLTPKIITFSNMKPKIKYNFTYITYQFIIIQIFRLWSIQNKYIWIIFDILSRQKGIL